VREPRPTKGGAAGVVFPASTDINAGMMRDPQEKDSKEPGDRHKVFWIYVLILGGGAALFFVGGLWVRNPSLPSYLYSQVTSWLNNESNPSSTRRAPAPPKTAADYLELTHYDVRALPADQRAIALALADAIGKAAAVQDRLSALDQNLRTELPTLQSANALSIYAKLKPEAATLLDAANQQKIFFETLESKLTQEFEKNELPEEMAKQVAALFYESTPGQKAVDQAAKLERLADELIAIANLLAETPNQWHVSADGTIHSTDKKLDAEYREHHEALEAAR
jgi:hypothetical protein